MSIFRRFIACGSSTARPRAHLLAGAVLLALSSLAGIAQAQSAPSCELKRPINFGGMNWESNLVLVDVQRFILEKGFGCDTEVFPTETLLALTSLERGDLDVNTEVWLNSVAEPWAKAEARGKVKRVGELYMGREGWFIPRYTAERYPELKSAADLPKFKDKFVDPEDPDKGRFYGCPVGWGCEIVNTNLFHAFGMDDSFTLFSPGTGAAQKAALVSAYKRKRDIVFYYWSPTTLAGLFDLVELEMPPYDADKHRCLTDDNCANPEPSAYPENPVFTALNTRFAQQAPQLADFFSNVTVPLPVMSATLAHLEETGDDVDVVAQWFLRQYGDVWKQWVSADVAARVQSAL